MAFPLMAIPAAIQTGLSIYDLFRLKNQKFKLSPEMEEALAGARRLANEGLTTSEESAMGRSIITPGQNALASAFASRGTSNSSSADQALVSLFGRAGEVVSEADMNARLRGKSLFGQMSSEVDNARRTFDMMKENATSEAWATLGEGLGAGFGELDNYFNPEPSMGEQYLNLYNMAGAQQPMQTPDSMGWQDFPVLQNLPPPSWMDIQGWRYPQMGY